MEMPSPKTEDKTDQDKDLKPLICIIGHNSLQNELLSMNISNQLEVTCSLYPELYLTELFSESQDRKYICLFDYRDFDFEKLEEYLDTADDKESTNILPALFNVHPNDSLKKLIGLNKLCAIFFQNDSQTVIASGIKSLLKNNFFVNNSEEFLRNIKSKKMLASLAPASGVESLTEREKEIMTLLATGQNNKEISIYLDISLHTVKTHVFNVYKKINAQNRLQASLWVVSNL